MPNPLLHFLELPQGRAGINILGRYRVNYGVVSVALFGIFMGLVFTRVAVIMVE